MDDLDPEEAARKKKTTLLLAGGAVSLVLPLLGVFYLRWIESKALPKQADAIVFQQREGADRRIMLPNAPAMAAAVALSQPAAVPSAPPSGQSSLPRPPSKAGAEPSGSLGFIKGNDDYYNDKKEEPAPEPKKEEPKTAPAPEPRPTPKATAKTKPGKKPFYMPKLNTGKGFTSMKRPGGQQQEAADAGAGDMDMQEMLKQIPGGASNPEVQKYLNQNR